MVEEEEIEEDDNDDGERVECGGCGRKFKPDSLQKHKKICKKVFQSKRKKFDMKNKRIIDGEHLEIIKNAEFSEKKNKNKALTPAEIKKKANKVKFQINQEKWKKQSEEFRRMLKGGNAPDNNVVVANVAGNGLITNKIEPSYDDGLEHCGMCNRRYNPDAFKKHLPHCEKKKKESLIKNNGKNAPNTTTTTGKKK